jgi:hypothetical protein
VIVAAHQPAYLPWLGYLAKVEASDVFVVMDDLQYEAQNFQNRNRLKLNHGAAWLTVPLERGPQTQRICDKRISNAGSAKEHWAHRHWQTMQVHYGAAPYWSTYAGALAELYRERWESLLALDLRVLSLCMQWFDIRKPVVLASSLSLSGQRSERILSACRAVRGDVYLAGRGGSTHYLDVELLARHGVRVAWQSFRHPSYVQRYPALGFISHLSALDLLLNCGPGSAEILRQAMVEPAPLWAEAR